MEVTHAKRLTESFTLIVPTYNRPAELAHLVGYLDRQQPAFKVLILDSSNATTQELNKAAVEGGGLNVRFHGFDPDISPWEKFWRGSEMVDTAYCSLCADDDVVVLSSLPGIVNFLDANPDYSVAHGWYFTFYNNVHLGITSSVYRGRSIEDDDIMARLFSLFRNYEAVTYGVYRTEVMRSVLESVQGVTSMLGRELLGGALSVVRGKVARLPVFYYGRQHFPSHPYAHWHPLDFLVSSSDELYRDYAAYRAILLKRIRATGYEKYTDAELLTLIDLIHFRYLSDYVKPRVMDYLTERAIARAPKQDVMQGLWSVLAREGDRSIVGALSGSLLLRRIRDRFFPKLRLHHLKRLAAPAEQRTLRSTTSSGRDREYLLYREFLSSLADERTRDKEIRAIIGAMDNYE